MSWWRKIIDWPWWPDALERQKNWRRRWLLGWSIWGIAITGLVLAGTYAWWFNRTYQDHVTVTRAVQDDLSSTATWVKPATVLARQTGEETQAKRAVEPARSREEKKKKISRSQVYTRTQVGNNIVGKELPSPRFPLAGGQLIFGYGQIYWPVFGDYRFHHGMDIRPAENNNLVRAVWPGQVKTIRDGSEGPELVLSHAQGWETVYGNLQGIKVRMGQRVEGGQVLGLVAPGELLHFAASQRGEAVNPAVIFP
ncbi:M23 family metallopeptidase [Carboxydocella sp. ULO1]|uniref:M23 family metallopeptidase n=1 Tax=Carboxydocella sp. ULO1 TaxID=1926599 RepID=UPI0009AE3F62|nr:M23 family metallopeptidase [Carboxydocella sp. ULO1]GAW29442.1 hypothetical protein ULO1_20120 [Carboxydocella sp. ULO1]